MYNSNAIRFVPSEFGQPYDAKHVIMLLNKLPNNLDIKELGAYRALLLDSLNLVPAFAGNVLNNPDDQYIYFTVDCKISTASLFAINRKLAISFTEKMCLAFVLVNDGGKSNLATLNRDVSVGVDNLHLTCRRFYGLFTAITRHVAHQFSCCCC